VRRILLPAVDISEVIDQALTPPPCEVLRPVDLVHLTFSFHNLTITRGEDGPPALVRRRAGRPAFLSIDFGSQHFGEEALFEFANGYPVKNPPPPSGLSGGSTPPTDPDTATPPKPNDKLRVPPVFASLSGPSRIVLRVAEQVIPFTIEGLLAAVPRLDLSVAAHAVPPQSRLFRFDEIFIGDAIDVARLHVPRGLGRRGASDVSAGLVAIGRLRATAANLEYRFGTNAALDAASATRVGKRLRVDRLVAGTESRIPRNRLPPIPSPPAETETSLELPWRLLVSPNAFAAFIHSPTAVEHEGRYELWHSRLGVRATDKDGNPTVDELPNGLRTIRAIWARDYDILPKLYPGQGFEFSLPPSQNFPHAAGDQDSPRIRMPLNSRDRMMLVHETSNFHLKRNGRSGWIPESVPTNRLMLTSLGGWLDSGVQFNTLPDGELTIEEWKHRAALGRDYEVKVVYAGFLLPFGHRASLVKVTERKIEPNAPAGPTAYLFQRVFLIVREPERRFRTDSRPLDDGRRADLVMPFAAVRIVTRVTPPLDPPTPLTASPPPPVTPAPGFLFEPTVLGAPFQFKVVAVDLESNIVEFSAPLVFMERDHNDKAPDRVASAVYLYNRSTLAHREMDLRGQRVAYAEGSRPDDTILETQSLTFQAVTSKLLHERPQDEPRFTPTLEVAKAVVPAMSILAGAAEPVQLAYPTHFAQQGFADNASQVFLEVLGSPPMDFAGQGDRSGGLVTPSLNVSGLSRLTGPMGGDLANAINPPAGYSVGDFFAGIAGAKLFGLIPLSELFGKQAFSPDRIPAFVTQTLDVASAFKQNVERLRNAAAANAAVLGAAATTLQSDVDALLADLAALLANPTGGTDPVPALAKVAGDLQPFVDTVEALPAGKIAQAEKQQLLGVADRIKDQLENGAAVGNAAKALKDFANGLKLPEVVTARVDWSTGVDPWPTPGDGAIFSPGGGTGKLTLAVELQAPTVPGKQPTALVSCSLSPFDLRLIAPVLFLTLRFKTIEFSMTPGKKPDVNVQFKESDGIHFDGPLTFVNTLKSVIPFDGFSDPPYLDVSATGVKAGFDLGVPDLAVGVFALTNITLGANFRVPFVDESIETSFNFSTRENPFRLQVALFAGGGFFGVTITPDRVRVLEAAFEFGAAISVNLGVASGGVSVMAGIYFRIETSANGDSAQLTGYFRMRGEVDVLGLVSACIELYLDLTYETSSGKAVGHATLTIEISIAFFSTSVSISCEKKFAGSSKDPTFAELMGLEHTAPPTAVRPWDIYVQAFAKD
jgi:hypothetical protein